MTHQDTGTTEALIRVNKSRLSAAGCIGNVARMLDAGLEYIETDPNPSVDGLDEGALLYEGGTAGYSSLDQFPINMIDTLGGDDGGDGGDDDGEDGGDAGYVVSYGINPTITATRNGLAPDQIMLLDYDHLVVDLSGPEWAEENPEFFRHHDTNWPTANVLFRDGTVRAKTKAEIDPTNPLNEHLWVPGVAAP